MQINDQHGVEPPRAAATIVLLRDAADGMEVFMVRRHGLSAVLGGACVFPGGKVDLADADPGLLQQLCAPLDQLHGALCEPQLDRLAAAAYFVAACRETFEEAGILLAEGASTRHVEKAQIRVRAGLHFGEAVSKLGLQLEWRNVVPWSRWITPAMPELFNRRFDTRFFLAPVPNDQHARHDNHEATASFWLRPRVILEQYWARKINLAPAQIMSLAALARQPLVSVAIAAARARRPPLIQPEPFMHGPLRALALPGDQHHPIVERALPGPSFLIHRNQRFEPIDGFEALFV